VSRVESETTWGMWGLSEEQWHSHLCNSGTIAHLIKYYEDGIALMEARNRDIIGSHKYADLVNSKLGEEVTKREKTKDFYRLRLKELEG